MKAETVRKVILGCMVLVLITVWVRNLLLFFPGSSKRNRSATPEQVVRGEELSADLERPGGESAFVYVPSRRDPFAMPIEKSPTADSLGKRHVVKPLVESPHALLQGIVWSPKAPRIVVFDSLSMQTLVLRQKDALNGYQVLMISKSQVTMISKRQKIVWKSDEKSH